MEALSQDSATQFNAFLRNPSMAPKAIERVVRHRHAGFRQTRVLAFWHLLRKTQCDRVAIDDADREGVMEYFYEVVEGPILEETRRHLAQAVDDPSWVWLHALRRLWSPDMARTLPQQIRRVGAERVLYAVTPLIQDFHAKNRPFEKYTKAGGGPMGGGHQRAVEIPSQWYRSLLYPMLGGEPRGLFDDTPMSYTETLSSMFSLCS